VQALSLAHAEAIRRIAELEEKVRAKLGDG
jgi:hypothetical protein